MWGRLTPHPRLMQELATVPGRRVVPTRVAPVSLFAREDAPVLLAATGEELARLDLSARLSAPAQSHSTVLAGSWRQFLVSSCMEPGCWPLKWRTGCGRWWLPGW